MSPFVRFSMMILDGDCPFPRTGANRVSNRRSEALTCPLDRTLASRASSGAVLRAPSYGIRTATSVPQSVTITNRHHAKLLQGSDEWTLKGSRKNAPANPAAVVLRQLGISAGKAVESGRDGRTGLRRNHDTERVRQHADRPEQRPPTRVDSCVVDCPESAV